VNRGDIKLAIDMIDSIDCPPFVDPVLEHVVSTLEDCGNEIASLKAEITRLKAENERLSNLCDKWNFECDEYREDNKRLADEIEALKAQSAEPVAYRHRDGMFSCRLPGGGVAGIDWTPLYTAAPRDEQVEALNSLCKFNEKTMTDLLEQVETLRRDAVKG
jgi:uncharacterized small protein (DUF1192 family)